MNSQGSSLSITRPLALLPFEEALQITPLLNDLQKAAQSSLMSELAQFPGDISSAGLQAASLGMHWGTHAAEFTRETEALLRSSQLTLTHAKGGGGTFLTARNGRGFVENAKLVKGAGAAAKLANVVAIVVNVCHVVSGIDTARKVERISKDVQFLREARRVTQLSRLEAMKVLHGKAGYIKETSAKQGVSVAPLLNHFDSIVRRFQEIKKHDPNALLEQAESANQKRSAAPKRKTPAKKSPIAPKSRSKATRVRR